IHSAKASRRGTVALQAMAQLTGGETLQTLLTYVRGPMVFTQRYGYKAGRHGAVLGMESVKSDDYFSPVMPIKNHH
ncbi:MAG TPA: hypothetical protein PK406_14660, partial [Verrucomicrobiota bacterium]|nr:hypothetical protein [Verrucomicrobiota bacterium]